MKTERSRLHEALAEHGSAFGYLLTKCHIIAKKNHLENTKEISKNKDVDFLEGHPVLGSVIGSASACHDFKNRARARKNHFETHSMSKRPQNVLQAYTKGLQTELSFLTNSARHGRVPAGAQETSQENLIPSLPGKNTATTTNIILFSLPVRNGGLNITLPEDKINLRWSKSLGNCLYNVDPMTAENAQHRIKPVIKRDVDGKTKSETDQLYALHLASEKGCPIGSTPYPSQETVSH